MRLYGSTLELISDHKLEWQNFSFSPLQSVSSLTERAVTNGKNSATKVFFVNKEDPPA